MEKATIIGVDLAADGTVLFRKKLTRLQSHRFMAEQPACLVAMEVCGGVLLGARDAAARISADRIQPNQ